MSSTFLRTEAQTPAAWFTQNADCLSPSEQAEALWNAALALERGENALAVWRTLESAGDLGTYPIYAWLATPPVTLAAQCRAESNRLQTQHALCPRCWASECEECGPRWEPREGWPVQAAVRGWG